MTEEKQAAKTRKHFKIAAILIKHAVAELEIEREREGSRRGLTVQYSPNRGRG